MIPLAFLMVLMLIIMVVLIVGMVYLHRRYMRSLGSRHMNVLIVLTHYIVNTMGLGCIVNMTTNIWRQCFGHINKVVYILLTETYLTSIWTVLMVAFASMVLKILLTARFDLVHNKDPESLGRNIFLGVATMTSLSTLANIIYILVSGHTVHSNMAYFTGEKVTSDHINMTLVALLLQFILDLGLMAVEKALAKHYLHKKCSDNIRLSEQKRKAKICLRKQFSIKNIIYATCTATIFAISALVKILIVKNFEDEDVMIIYTATMKMVLFMVMYHLTFDDGLKLYLRRRIKRYLITKSFEAELMAKAATESNKVSPRV